jgi:hypothetical protein
MFARNHFLFLAWLACGDFVFQRRIFFLSKFALGWNLLLISIRNAGFCWHFIVYQSPRATDPDPQTAGLAGDYGGI